MRNVLSILIIIIVVGSLGILLALAWYRGGSDSNDYIGRWLRNPDNFPEYMTPALTRCGDAPFVVPSEGFIGLLWRDSARPYTPLRRHTGIDIFGAGEPGTVPIYAVYEGYLTRLPDWRSTVIIRHDDPLEPGRTIWTYYTHMASRDGDAVYIAEEFPPGSSEVFVEQGRLLGYQGDYNPGFAVAMHLHMSIVTSAEDGAFLNESILENTLDPSPYFGFPLNIDGAEAPVRCVE